jgi:hypothetical protein
VSDSGSHQLNITIGELGFTSVTTPTFSGVETAQLRGYKLFASPTLYPGQTVSAVVSSSATNAGPVDVGLALSAIDPDDNDFERSGTSATIQPGETTTIEWTIPDLAGDPVSRIGLKMRGAPGDSIDLDSLTWDGAPTVTLGRRDGAADSERFSDHVGSWKRAWIDGVDSWQGWFKGDYHLVQNEGIGLIAQGTEAWHDYSTSASIRIPLAKSAGIAVRVGGMRRYYGFVLAEGGKAQIVKAIGERTVLAEVPFDWEVDREYALELSVVGTKLTASIDGEVVLETEDAAGSLRGGSVGLVIEEGNLVSGPVKVTAE